MLLGFSIDQFPSKKNLCPVGLNNHFIERGMVVPFTELTFLARDKKKHYKITIEIYIGPCHKLTSKSFLELCGVNIKLVLQ